MKYYLKVGIEHLALGMIIPISIVWKLNSGLSIYQVAVTEALILIVTALSELPTGYFADKYGNKISLFVGSIFQIISLLLLANGNNMTIFIFAAIASGIGWAFISGADEAYIHDDYIEDKSQYKKTFSTALIVDEAATVLGMLLVSLLLFVNIIPKSIFIIAGILLVINSLYIAFVLPKSKLQILKAPQESSLENIKSMKNNIFILLPVIVAFAIMYESGRFLWQPQLKTLGIDIATFGLIFALLKLASILGSLLARQRKFHTTDLLIIFILLSVSLLLFGSKVVVVSIGALLIFLFIENYLRVYMSTVLNKLITKQRASLLSVASFTRNIVGGSLIVLMGLFAQKTILLALVFLVIIKIPAIVYILRKNDSWT